ncbi:hypothetical protein CEXT_71271 [Caerostris extrusa]|uniref:Uncharacterized protein n=1 Tax=Caerostris extrusa TaxID=172846 RepID=A0AAV4U577_CAEEX|nr:hypothetical protein CEXT_71271 [Caerostris extrusa]
MGGSYPHREMKPVGFLINGAHTSFPKLMVSLPRDFSFYSEKKKKGDQPTKRMKTVLAPDQRINLPPRFHAILP